MKIKIDNISITKPTSFRVNVVDIEEGTQMSDGSYVRDVIATKRELDIQFGTLSWANCSTILTLLKEPFFEVYYPDPISGAYETKSFYVKTQSVPFVKEYKNVLYWQGLSMVLIEG